MAGIMEYPCERIEGWKRNTSLYKVNAHLYYQNTTYGGRVYLRCILKKKFDCRGSAILMTATNSAHMSIGHNHGPEEYEIERMELVNDLKRHAESSTESLRDVFNKTAKNHPLGYTVSYKQIENTLYKRRRLSEPRVPSSVTELATMLSKGDILEAKNYKGCATDGKDQSLLFFSTRMADTMSQTKHIQIDATFKKVPSSFHQLLTIFAVFETALGEERSFPAVHVLMTSDTPTLCEAALKKLKAILPGFKPEVAICDYSFSTRNALTTVYPGIELQGCFLQYCRCVWKTILDLKMEASYLTNADLNIWVKKLMCLPMLPADNILSAFDSLCRNSPLLDADDQDVYTQLKTHFRNCWLHQIDIGDLSLFQAEMRPSNGSDAYYKTLSRRLTGRPPKMWPFIHVLGRVISDTDKKLEDYELGCQIRSRQKIKHELDVADIRICKDELLRGFFTVPEFLDGIAHAVSAYTDELFGLSGPAASDNETSAQDHEFSDDFLIFITFKDQNVN